MNYKTTSKIIVTGLLFGLAITEASAQVVQKIGKNSFTINPNAVLELESDSKGFLPPRMANLPSGLSTSDKGLIVYLTSTNPGLQIWTGTKWVVFVDNEALDGKADLAGATFTGAIAATNLSGSNTGDETTESIKTALGVTTLSGDNTGDNASNSLYSGLANSKADLAGATFTGAIAATNLSGSNTGDETTESIKTALGITTLSGDNTGDNASNSLYSGLANSKADLAGATFTGAIAATNLSGSNTGDETTESIKTALGVTILSGDNTGDNASNSLYSGLANSKADLAGATFTGAIAATNLSGSNTGDETTESIKTALGVTILSGGNTGDQDLSTLTTKIETAAAETNAIATAATDAADKVLVEKNRATAAEEALNASKENTANKSNVIDITAPSNDKFPTVSAVINYVARSINSVRTITASTTAIISDYSLLCNTSSGAFTLSLPAADANNIGKIYVIRKTDPSNNVLTFSLGLILDETNTITELNYPKTIKVQSDGSNWHIIN